MIYPTISFLKYFLETLKNRNIVMAHLRYKPLTEDVTFDGDYGFVTSPKNTDNILQVLFDMVSAANINFVINRVKYGKLMIYINTANSIENCTDVLMQTAGIAGIKAK